MQTHLCIADLSLFLRTTAQASWQENSALDEKSCDDFRQAIPAPQLCRTLKTLATLIMLSSNNARFE